MGICKSLCATGIFLLVFQTAVYANYQPLSFQDKKDIICEQCFKGNAEKCKLANIQKNNVDAKFSVYLEMNSKSKKEYPKEPGLFYFKQSDIDDLIYSADKTNYNALIKAIENDWCYKKDQLYAGNLTKDDNNIYNLKEQDLTDFLKLLEFKYKTPFTFTQAADLIDISTKNTKDSTAFINNMDNPVLSSELVKNLDLVRLFISREMYSDFEHYNLHYPDMDKLLADFPMKNRMLLYLYLKKQDSKNKDDIIRILHEGPYYYRLNEEIIISEEKLPDMRLKKTDIFQLYPKRIYDDLDGLKILILYANHYNYDGTMICDMWQITHKMKDFSVIRDDLDNGVFKYYYEHYRSCPYDGYLEDYKLYKIMKKAGFIKENDIKAILSIHPESCKKPDKLYFGTKEEKLNRILAEDDLTNEEKIQKIKKSFSYENINVKGYVKSHTSNLHQNLLPKIESILPVKK